MPDSSLSRLCLLVPVSFLSDYQLEVFDGRKEVKIEARDSGTVAGVHGPVYEINTWEKYDACLASPDTGSYHISVSLYFRVST